MTSDTTRVDASAARGGPGHSGEGDACPRVIGMLLRRASSRCAGLFLAFLLRAPLPAADFYVDPVLGSDGGDGSLASPWRTIERVIASGKIETRDWATHPYVPGLPFVTVHPGAPVKAGDTLWLASGDHGEIDLAGAYNALPIVIAALPGETPRVTRIALVGTQNWEIRGVAVSPSFAVPPLAPGTMARFESDGWWGPTWDVTLAESELYSVDDASGWSANDWISAASSGIFVDGDRVTIRDNRLRNVRFGISVAGADARILFNTINGFSADGLRGLGDGDHFEYNVVRNAKVDGPLDGNHDDGFQSWSVGPGGVGTGEVADVLLRGNVIVNADDSDDPLRSTLQGIGCFDGLFVRWTVENNVVVTDHWHGISFYGMLDSTIVNNTVLDINSVTPGPPWIMVTSSNGTPSQNVTVRNNLATDYSLDAVNLVSDHNVEIVNPAALFEAPPFDVHLLANPAAVDAGSTLLAPGKDADRIRRPQGAAPDLGAYERCPDCLFADDFERGDLSGWSTH